jgi:hypothetical protein
MFMALVVLLLQPQVHPQRTIDLSQLDTPAAISSPVVAGKSSSVVSVPMTAPVSAKPVSVSAASSPAPAPAMPAATPAAPAPSEPAVLTQVPAAASESSSITLPDAPNPAMAPAFAGRSNPVKAMFFNVVDPQFESRRDKRMWLGLSIAEHSAAGFDAWTTRREISSGQAQELDPFLKPFAGNSSIYVATQFMPVVLDCVGHHMMYSTHSWERHVWWLPQALGTASSIAAGAHNLTVRAIPAQ